jgi:hypothetical protein
MRSLIRSVSVVAAAGLAVLSLTAAACGPEVDLAKSVEIVDVQSGYYDMGIIDGKTKIVPQAIVHIKNVGTAPLPGFQISASYWRVGDDGMSDETIGQELVASGLAPGATSDAIVLRGNVGYTLDVSRAEAFQNSMFRDFTIKVFGKVGGRMAKLGELNVDQKIVPKDATVPTM